MMGPPPTRITPFPARPRLTPTDISFPPLSQPIPLRSHHSPLDHDLRRRILQPPTLERTASNSKSSAYPVNSHQQILPPSSQPQSYSFSPSPITSRHPTPAPTRGIVDTYRPATPLSEPRSAAEIYTQSVEPKVSMGDRIITAITGLGGRLDTLQEGLDTVRDAQMNIRDQVHGLQTCQRSLATREEIIEEITNQLSPALHEFFQNLHDKIDTALQPLPNQTAERSAEKIKAILLDLRTIDQKSQDSQSQSKESLSTLIKHLTSSLTPVQNLTDLLQSLKELPQAVRDVAIFKTSLDDIRDKIDKPSSPPGWDDMKQSVESIKAGTSSKRGVDGHDVLLQELKALREALDDVRGKSDDSDTIASLVEMVSATRAEIGEIKKQITQQRFGIPLNDSRGETRRQDQRVHDSMGQQPEGQPAPPVPPIRRAPHVRGTMTASFPAPPEQITQQPVAVDAFGPVIPIDQTVVSTNIGKQAKSNPQPLPSDGVSMTLPIQVEEDGIDTTTATSSSSSSEASNRSGSWKPDNSKSKKSKKRKASTTSVAQARNSNPLKGSSTTQSILPGSTARTVIADPISQDRSTSTRMAKKPKLTQTNLRDTFPVTSGHDLDLGIMTRARSVSVKKVLNGGVSNVNDPIVIGSSSEDSLKKAAQTGGFVPGIETGVAGVNGRERKVGVRLGKGKAKVAQVEETPTPMSKDVKAELILSQPAVDSLNSLAASEDLEPALPSSNTTNPEVDETEDYLLETQYPGMITSESQLPQTQSLAPDPDSFVEGQQQLVPRGYATHNEDLRNGNVGRGRAGNGRFQRLGSSESPPLLSGTGMGTGIGFGTGSGIGGDTGLGMGSRTGSGSGTMGRKLTTYGSHGGGVGMGRGAGRKVSTGGAMGSRIGDTGGWDSSEED